MKYVIFTFLLLSQNIFSQIINIENKRFHTDTAKVIFKYDIDADFIKNNKKQIDIEQDFAIQVKLKNSKLLLVSSYDYNNTDGKINDDSYFANLRYRHIFTNRFSIEIYNQYQHNMNISLNKRLLFGVGYRYKLIDRNANYMYISFEKCGTK